MTIVNPGKNRVAFLLASTFSYTGVGQGTATAVATNTWLGSSVYVKSNTVAVAINNQCTYNTLFDPSQGNSTATVTEVIVADTSTSIGSTNLLIRSVASTNTWTSITKDSSKYLLISLQLTVSA